MNKYHIILASGILLTSCFFNDNQHADHGFNGKWISTSGRIDSLKNFDNWIMVINSDSLFQFRWWGNCFYRISGEDIVNDSILYNKIKRIGDTLYFHHEDGVSIQKFIKIQKDVCISQSPIVRIENDSIYLNATGDTVRANFDYFIAPLSSVSAKFTASITSSVIERPECESNSSELSENSGKISLPLAITICRPNPYYFGIHARIDIIDTSYYHDNYRRTLVEFGKDLRN